MKKIGLFTALAVSVTGVTAMAASDSFTDEGQFAEWFKDSAAKMRYNEIITGYQDGSFGPTNPVSRAELSVILDRYARVTGNELRSEPVVCTEEYVYGLTVHLQDQDGNPITDATISIPNEEGFEHIDEGMYIGLGEAETGHYTFEITKEGYSDHVETVKLENTECHVIPQVRTITLIDQS